jgi:spermidine/putrescine transport system permease protein
MRLPSGMKLVNVLCGWWTVLVLLFLYLPIGLLIAFSFNQSRLNIEWKGFTLDWYRVMAGMEPSNPPGDEEARAALESIQASADTRSAEEQTRVEAEALGAVERAEAARAALEEDKENAKALIPTLYNSLKVASLTTVLAVLLGTTGAWLLYRYRYRWKRMWETLLFIPMAIPEIIMGVSFLLFFTAIYPAMNGWLDALLGPSESLRLDRGLLTIVIAHTTFCFPFVLVAVQARLADVDPSLEEAALDLGSTPLGAFWRVMVPYMMPAIISGALMCFTLSMDEVIVTYFITGPDSKTLPLEIYGHVKKGINPMLNAVSAVFIIVTAVLVVLAERIRKLNR